MSVTTPRGLSYEEVYGEGQGRGDVEAHVIQTLRDWVVPYVADYEAEHGLAPRTLPVPPTLESFHGDIDFARFSQDLFPELIVVAQPAGAVERYGDGTYGSWFEVAVAAVVQVEGSQDLARGLADAYGTALQKLLPQQGAFGTNPDGSLFADRTRLQAPYSVSFPDANVRDIVRATVAVRTFVANLVSDSDGPRVPPLNPYGIPDPWPEADKVQVNVVDATPDEYADGGIFDAAAVILDDTVSPEVTEFEHIVVVVPPPD